MKKNECGLLESLIELNRDLEKAVNDTIKKEKQKASRYENVSRDMPAAKSETPLKSPEADT